MMQKILVSIRASLWSARLRANLSDYFSEKCSHTRCMLRFFTEIIAQICLAARRLLSHETGVNGYKSCIIAFF
jgi:hypothetical protein